MTEDKWRYWFVNKFSSLVPYWLRNAWKTATGAYVFKLLRLKGSAFIVRSILVPLSIVTFRLFCSRSRSKKARLRCLRRILPQLRKNAGSRDLNSIKMQVQNIFKAQKCWLLLLAVFFHSVFQGSFSASFPYFCFTAVDVNFIQSVLRYSHLFFSSCKTEFIHLV